MSTTPEQLRARRGEALRKRQVRRRRIVAGTSLVALAAGGALAIGLLGGDDSAPEPLAAPGLPTEQLVGQRLIAGFEGTEVPRGLRRMIARGELAGVVLFAENVSGRAATRRMLASIQRIPRPDGLRMPLAVMVDQEGGLVERVPGPPGASAQQMGKRGTAFARRQGAATARSLAGLGINVDLAPVLDVGRPGAAITEEHRSFGRTPARVIGAGVDGFAAGLRHGGVATTAKHFPGLGAAAINTDASTQEIHLSRARLRAVDERPFEAFSDAGGDLIMLSLATYTALSDRPAAFSRSIVTGELRRRLGFEGVSITDSLDAAAALALGSRARVAVAAADAGADLLLYSDWHTARGVSRTLRRKLAAGELDRAEFEASVERVLELRRGLAE